MPLQFDLIDENNTIYSIICKKGNDLRLDCYLQTIFQLFNDLWKNHLAFDAPFIQKYEIIPLTTNFGIIEMIPDAQSVYRFEWLREKIKNFQTFRNSLAGSYLAAHVLGIQDRHENNMLVKNGSIFFNVDLNLIWNKVRDSTQMIIPQKIKQVFDDEEWNSYVQCVMKGFCVLYDHSKLIQDMSTTLFHQLERKEDIRQCLIGTLMDDYTQEQALEILETRLNNDCIVDDIYSL
jgi:hypothetical protein